jgi:hypothetical protein
LPQANAHRSPSRTGDRETAIPTAGSPLATREELLSTIHRHGALLDWQTGDDSQFDGYTRAMSAEDERIAALSFEEWAAMIRADGLRGGFDPEETDEVIRKRGRGLTLVKE